MCHWWFEARYQQEVLKARTQACGLGWRRPRRVVWTASPHNPTLDTEGCQTLGLPGNPGTWDPWELNPRGSAALALGACSFNIATS
jgi:hypothetical protein